MGGRKLSAAQVPTPGPWLVRGEAEADAPAELRMLGVEPAGEDRPGGFPYLIRQDLKFAPGDCPLHLAVGIQRLADARLMAAAPDLAAALLSVLIVRELRSADPDAQTQRVVAAAWDLLVRVTPQLEIP
nr:hypothetical protein [Methylobacterium sp. L1A1]